jgi:uncharacterized protein (DUF427 family)
MQAIWRDIVVAQSEKTILVEGNHYFPPESLKDEFFTFSNHKSTCPWKGLASYKSLCINGELLSDAAWFYPDPKPEAEQIKGYFAFWKEVKIKEN